MDCWSLHGVTGVCQTTGQSDRVRGGTQLLLDIVSSPSLHVRHGSHHLVCSMLFVLCLHLAVLLLHPPNHAHLWEIWGWRTEVHTDCNLPSCRAFSFSDNCFFSPRTGSISPLVIFYGTQQMTKQPHHSPYHSTDNKPLPCSITALLR